MAENYVSFLEKTMDVSALKRKTNADNIANINTPGFKATKVEFDYLLDKQIKVEMKESRNNHIAIQNGNEEGFTMSKNTSTKERYDENNVDLNEEMIEMIENNYVFGISVQAMNKEFALNKTALGK